MNNLGDFFDQSQPPIFRSPGRSDHLVLCTQATGKRNIIALVIIALIIIASHPYSDPQGGQIIWNCAHKQQEKAIRLSRVAILDYGPSFG